MAIQPISALAPTPTSPFDGQRPGDLGKSDFLHLLTAQLEHQDPLNPQDPAEFTSQLTQFSNLEQLISVNDSLESLQLLQLSSNNAQTTALLGKDVLYAGDALKIENGEPADLRFNSTIPLNDVAVEIVDSNGTVVRSIQLGDQTAGTHTIPWNGKDANGNTLNNGNYTVRFSGFDAAGTPAVVTPLSMGRATGLHFENGNTLLEVNGQKLTLADIFSIFEPAVVQGTDQGQGTNNGQDPIADPDPIA